jgi:hypothetical protein
MTRLRRVASPRPVTLGYFPDQYPRAFAHWRWVAHPLMIKTAGAR